MIDEITGDLFATPDLDALAHGVNCTGVMGAGIAVTFRKLHPEMFAEYARRCRARELRPGNLFAWQAAPMWVYNLATQPRPGPSATLPAIRSAVEAMVEHARSAGVKRIGMPRVGCGLGGLRWEAVRPVIEAAAQGVEIVVVSLPERRAR